MSIQNVTIDTTALETRAGELSKEFGLVTAYAITNELALAAAGDTLRNIRNGIKELDDKRKEITRPMDEAKAQIMAIVAPFTAQLEQALQVVSKAIVAFEQEQERKLLEAQKAAQEKAKREAEQREQEMLAQAEKLLAEGKTVAAAELEERSRDIVVIPEVVPVRAFKPKNVGTTTRWKARVTNLKQLPKEFMMPDEKKLQAHATQYQDQQPVKGVEFYSETSASLRSVR